MPRDSSGNYTLPAGNPVITNTIITSDWANTTMSDMGTAMTDSLSRSGLGGMLAPLPFVDGNSVQPAVTFTLEPTLGFYREGTSQIGVAGLGVQFAVFNGDTQNISVLGPLPLADADLTRKDYVDSLIDALSAQVNKPVGALEFGYDPNGILAGTWTQLPEGTFIMNTIAGADPAGGSNDAVAISHTHSIEHDHPATTSGNQSATHTHSITHNHDAVQSGNNNLGHTHSINHNHASVTSSSNNRDHTHNNTGAVMRYKPAVPVGNTFGVQDNNGATDDAATTGANSRTHTHTVDLPNYSGTSGAVSQNHTHSVNLPNYTGNSGTQSASHTHSTNIPNYTGSSGSAGVSGTGLNRPLYKGLAVWERTA